MIIQSKLDIQQEAAERVTQARCRLLVKEPWYGHAAMLMDWFPDEMELVKPQFKTMGVRVLETGRVECAYYPKFVMAHSVEQIYGCVQHEIEHIIRLHCLRKGNIRDHELWNYAVDMVVNGKESRPKIGYAEDGKVLVFPIEKPVWCPEKWDDTLTAEQYYDLMHKEKWTPPVGCLMIDCHDFWSTGTASEDFGRQVIKRIADAATARAPGSIPGSLKEAIAKLSKPVVHWEQLLHYNLGKHLGSRRSTWSRRNRRLDTFGVKGSTHHGVGDIQLITDTSGSVGIPGFQMFFGEIDRLASRARTWVLQWDHGFQGYGLYRRGGWKNWKISGRGGTDMCAPLAYLEEKKLISDVCIMFTDGEVAAWPDPRPYPMIFVVCNTVEPVKKPKWGHYIFVDIARAS